MRLSRLLVVWVPVCFSVPALVLSALYGAECENRKAKNNPCPEPVTVTVCNGAFDTRPCANRTAAEKRSGMFECIPVSGSNTNCVPSYDIIFISGLPVEILEMSVCWNEIGCKPGPGGQGCVNDPNSIIQHFREVYKNEPCGGGVDQK